MITIARIATMAITTANCGGVSAMVSSSSSAATAPDAVPGSSWSEEWVGESILGS